jgi:hypothetical protein
MRLLFVALVLPLLLVGATGCGGSKKKAASDDFGGDCGGASTASAGPAQIAAKAVGKGYAKLIVIHATDKQSGAPLRHAHVTIKGEMTCPMVMSTYEEKLKETSKGTYKGGYTFVMEGDWTLNIILRSEQGDATTSALPVNMKLGG